MHSPVTTLPSHTSSILRSYAGRGAFSESRTGTRCDLMSCSERPTPHSCQFKCAKNGRYAGLQALCLPGMQHSLCSLDSFTTAYMINLESFHRFITNLCWEQGPIDGIQALDWAVRPTFMYFSLYGLVQSNCKL